MLKAVLHGKAGRVEGAVTSSTPWRDVVKVSEDLLTAIVFARLAYLDGPLFWKILREAFQIPEEYRVKELESIAFWPNWQDPAEGHERAQPDCYMTFQLEAPPSPLSVILEAKLSEYRIEQDPVQWRQQERAFEALPSRVEGAPAIFLAIGGLGASAAQTVQCIKEQAHLTMPAYGSSWSQLATVLANGKLGRGCPATGRIIGDILKGLDLAGRCPILPLNKLKQSVPSGWEPIVHIPPFKSQ